MTKKHAHAVRVVLTIVWMIYDLCVMNQNYLSPKFMSVHIVIRSCGVITGILQNG
jgi:hypothetical protein